jgi:phosphate transport system substrate-binding protein
MLRLLFSLSLVLLAVCSGCERSSPAPGSPLPTVVGAGATFPAPLYEQWILKYGTQTGRQVVYRPTGSTKGIEAITTASVDFAGSDTPMTDYELGQAGDVLHIPLTAGAIVLAYNDRSGLPEDLHLTSEAVAAIYLGKITHWDDRAIAALNPSAQLPHLPIQVRWRTDGSGTTKVFTEFLSKGNAEFRDVIGVRARPKWSHGSGAEGNDGVAAAVRSQIGALGYVTLAHAKSYRLPMAAVQNDAGRFVSPDLEPVAVALATAATALPSDLRASLIASRDERAYPLASFTFALVRQDMEDPKKREALITFLEFCLTEGQRYAPLLHYPALPEEVVRLARAQLARIDASQPVASRP